MTHILDGLAEQTKLQGLIATGVENLKMMFGIIPKLSIILVGNHPASEIYVEKKQAFAQSLGIETELFHLEENTSEEECLNLIHKLNEGVDVYGILLQLPLPKHLNSNTLIQAISPAKDVDGLHALNAGNLVQNNPGLYPCTPQGCMHLIHTWKKDLTGLTAVVVGRSHLVGRPLATLLTNENATVIQAHSHTKNLKDLTRLADILVVAVGKPGFITKEFVKEGACVIDVGISKNTKGETVGDVDFKSVTPVAGAISPVPGGVGPMTVTFLMVNLVKSCCFRKNVSYEDIINPKRD